MNIACNQMPLDNQSRRLTQFVLLEINKTNLIDFFYCISMGPSAFSAFMSKTFRIIILSETSLHFGRCFDTLRNKKNA